MGGYRNFQTDNNKYTDKMSRLNKDNPSFNAAVSINGQKESASFLSNVDKWQALIAYYRWYPDKFYDLLKSKDKGFDLGLDQRVILRVLARFPSTYSTFPRGYSKTLLEMMQLIHTAILYPGVKLSVTAQTRENAAKLMREKFEEILEAYPGIADEVEKSFFRTDMAKIAFKNGSVIDNLANSLSSNGARRHRGNAEEAFLIDEDVFLKALEPIFNVPRRIPFKGHPVDPYELNGAINFLTSAGYKGSPSFEKAYKMSENMANLTGDMVLGATWQLGYFYGRGEAKSKIMDKKDKNPKSYFDMNYMGRWVGSTENAFVNTEDLLACRTLEKCEYEAETGGEYILGVDIARSKQSNNNQSSISVVRIMRHNDGKIKSLNVVNIITIVGLASNFAQAVEIKKVKKRYNASVVIVDENGMGVFAIDELCRNTIDPATGEDLGCWGTLSDDERVPENPEHENCVYGLFAQSYQNEIVTAFMDLVSSKRVRLLKPRDNLDYEFVNEPEKGLPYIQTNFLQDEIMNLKIKHLNNGNLTLERNVSKMDKDRVSSTIYACWYAMKYMDRVVVDTGDDVDYLLQYISE